MRTYALIIAALAALGLAATVSADRTFIPGTSDAPPVLLIDQGQPSRYLTAGQPIVNPTVPGPVPATPVATQNPPLQTVTPGGCGYAGGLGWICLNPDGTLRR